MRITTSAAVIFSGTKLGLMRRPMSYRLPCILTSFGLSDDCLNQISNRRNTPEPGDFSLRLSRDDNSARHVLSPAGSAGASIPTAA